jgi:uncharacterized protein involved in tolerance to divalent cations
LEEKNMPASKSTRVVLVTCGNLLEARRIASKVVRKRLAACATIILGPVQSIYRWKGKVEVSREQLLLIKNNSPPSKRKSSASTATKSRKSWPFPPHGAPPTI